ncbi:hypothetical protein ACYSNM_09960 [Myroides sp. LJL116]
MKKHIVLIIIIGFFAYSCTNENKSDTNTLIENTKILNKLKKRAAVNLDSTTWDQSLFKQDIENYNEDSDFFGKYPLNNYPFPVADYNYTVYSNPFTIQKGSSILKGIQIGEHKSYFSNTVNTKLTLIVLTNDNKAKLNTFVSSRNYPYLTAEGNVELTQQNYPWVFQATPDGFSSLFFSMKLFDLRFGETIIIYPKEDNSFLYEQIEESPNHYSKFEDYIEKIKGRSFKYVN